MPARYHILDLARLSLSSGQGIRLEPELEAGAPELGGSEYRLAAAPRDATLEISRTATGYALRLRFTGHVEGACVRCLEQARVEVPVDALEVDQPSDDEELLSPYVNEEVLDLSGWAHDALVLALPQQLLCRADCAGLCQVCGESLNDAEPGAHDHAPAPDPRWAKLRELQ